MPKMISKFFGIAFLLITTILQAQTDSLEKPKTPERKPILCQIKMKDGSVYKGYIERQNDSLIYLKSSSGVSVHVPKKQVINIDVINATVSKDSSGNIIFQIPGIANSYYLASSNAFLLKKGEFYGSSSDLLFYNFNYAIDQHVSVGISSGIILAPVMLHMKANFEVSHKLYFGFDGFGATGSWASPKSTGAGGILKLTYGDVKKNITFFAGYTNAYYAGFTGFGTGRGGFGRAGGGGRRAYGRRRSASNNRNPNENTITAGAAFSYALTPKVNFVVEAFAFPEIGLYTFSPAIRTAIKPKFSWVFGLDGNYQANNTGNAIAYFNRQILPYLGFAFRL